MVERSSLPPIYIDEEPQEKVNLPAGDVNTVQLPDNIASQRAGKTELGLGPFVGKTKEELHPEFADGKESDIRRAAAAALDYEREKQKQKMVQDLFTKKQGQVTSAEVDAITQPFDQKGSADISSVIEDNYAKRVLSTLDTAKNFVGDSIIEKARKEIPEATQKTVDDGESLSSKNEYILTQMQNLQQLVGQQSMGGWVWDQTKGFIQLHNEYTQRGLVDGVYFGQEGLGLGGALEEQSNRLYSKPAADFKRNVDDIVKYFQDNPSLGVATLQALHGQSIFDQTLNNTFSVLAIPEVKLGAMAAASLAKKVSRVNEVRKATKDIVDAAAKNPDGSLKTLAEGAGDIKDAVVENMATKIEAAMKGAGDPIAAAKEVLLTTWKEDADKFAANQGTFLSRELLTRIQDGFVRDGEALINKIITMNRVERTPIAVTSRDVIDAYIAKIKNDYKGPANTLADVQGPIREPISGTYWYKSKVLNYDGTQFADRATAEGFAEQIGLANPVIKGVEADKVYLPPAAAQNLESVKTQGGVTKFYVDNDIEVVASAHPQDGFIPYNVKTGKFEAALTADQAKVEQQGLGFHIEVWTPMRENGDLVRDLMIHTPGKDLIKEAVSRMQYASSTKRLMDSVLGWVRNSDETLSVNESAQRKAATYTQSNIHKWASGLYKDLEDVASGRVRQDPVTGEPLSPFTYYPKSWTVGKISGKRVAEEFERTLDYARRATAPDAKAGDPPGYFFKTAGELQDHYQRNFKRDPSYLETRAYFNYTKLIEGDRTLGEIAEFRNRARIGTEQHTVVYTDVKTGERLKSPTFDGISKTSLPRGEDYMLIVGNTKEDTRLVRIDQLGDKRSKYLNERIEGGRGKLIEIYDRDHQPLNDFVEAGNNKLISYVYSERVETKPLTFNHIERRGGGHFEYDYDQYLKQADVRTAGKEKLYVGDKTVMPIKTRALGEAVAKLWNQAHEFIKEGKWEEVRPIAAKLGIKYDEFTGWYHPGRDADGKVVPPRLNPYEPITVVNKNSSISKMGSDLANRYRVPRADGNGYTDTFRDMTKSGPANNFKVAYNTERTPYEVKTINDVGSQGNPIYAHQPADMIDPLTTMNRALNRAINSTLSDDYKLYAVEHWLREAEKYIDAGGNDINKIRSSPFYYFNNTKYFADTPKEIRWNLESNKFKIQQFLGVPNTFDTWVHSLTANMADKFYLKYGPEESRSIFGKAVTIAPIWMLHHVTDPVGWMRSITFNAKLGLFAIPQFLVQAQTHSLIWALSPKHGTQATFGMLLHGWSEFAGSEKILANLDKYASKLGFKPGEWSEARRELENSGFKNVAGEYANINNQLKWKFIQNDFDKGLTLGQYPFRLGEQTTRITAWYTAFKEFRELHPNVPITNIERSQILSRADLLTVNMSRASSSAINHGVFSLSTQFLSYQIRLAELFLGKRLGETRFDRNLARARILGVYTALYGLPNALGVTGAPFSDNIRESLMDDIGYIPGEKWYSTMVNEGIPAWTFSMVTGMLPNAGDRFGSQGFQNIKQALRGDIPTWQALGGAAVSTHAKVLNAAVDPFYQMGASWARGDSPDARFRLKGADLVEPFKEISSVSTATKWWTAMQTGKWVAKNENNITDVSPLQATLLSLTGMSPQEQDDAFITNKMITGEIESQKGALKEFIKDWRRGVEALNNGDPEQARAFQVNAMARLTVTGYPEDKILAAIAIANKGWENSVDSAAMRMLKDGNKNKAMDRLDRVTRQLQMKDKQ